MKKNKIKDILLKIIKEPFLYVIIICVLCQLKMYQTVPDYVLASDSVTYMEGYTENIFKGEVNEARTPVYPYFIKIIEKIGGEENLEQNIVLIQKILFVGTTIMFYFAVRIITKNKILLSIMTLIFGICPYLVLWNVMILTEAISLLEMVALTLVTLLYLKKPNPILGASTGLIVFAMIMTRPSFIYLLPIYLLFWILRFFWNLKQQKEKRNAIIGTVSCAVCALLLLGYCGLMKWNKGSFSLTTISYLNQLISAIDSDSYQYASNPEMIKIVDEITQDRTDERASWEAYDALKEKYAVEDLKEFASSSIRNSPNYLTYLLNKTVRTGYLTIGTNYVDHKDYLADLLNNSYKGYYYLGNLILPINFAAIYILVAVMIVYLIWYLIRYKKIHWIIAFFTCVIGANVITLIVGAPFEQQRLFMASIPCVILIVTYGINILIGKKGKRNEEIIV